MTVHTWPTPLPILKQFIVPCPVLTFASWPAYRFLRRQERWSDIPISWGIFHSLLWSTWSKSLGVVNEAELDVFLENPSFFYDPMDVGNLISGSSAFSKSSLYIWNFSTRTVLKPSLKDFERYLASMWNEGNCAVVWTLFVISLFWDWNENWSFKSCGHCFPNLLAYWKEALSQHHPLRFEIAQLKFHSLH